MLRNDCSTPKFLLSDLSEYMYFFSFRFKAFFFCISMFECFSLDLSRPLTSASCLCIYMYRIMVSDKNFVQLIVLKCRSFFFVFCLIFLLSCPANKAVSNYVYVRTNLFHIADIGNSSSSSPFHSSWSVLECKWLHTYGTFQN